MVELSDDERQWAAPVLAAADEYAGGPEPDHTAAYAIRDRQRQAVERACVLLALEAQLDGLDALWGVFNRALVRTEDRGKYRDRVTAVRARLRELREG